MNRVKSKRNTGRKKILIIAMASIIVAASIFAVLELSGTTSVFNRSDSKPQSTEDRNAQTTSTLPTAQSDFSDGEYRDPGNTLHDNQGSGSIIDSNGTPSSNTSNPTTSSTGEITAYLPVGNTVVKSGQEVSGVSSLSNVTYRLIDSVTGVIATGQLKVVNGNFSGKLAFSTQANEGRLDIFGTRDDGSEFSGIEIPLRFQ